MTKKVIVDKVEYGSGSLPLIAGPCVIESREHSLKIAEAIRSITFLVIYFFSSSF